ncbi:MAG TPA: hypothetical protein EYP35_02845 [Desulfobacterales bacterium]|nr:hypothetical protein [Desulfobacterales bacterium]HIP39358.1 hypothetical protein [Desulfocapsa sulfexigens]
MKQQTLDQRLESYNVIAGSKSTPSCKLVFAASAVAAAGGILIPPPAEASIVYSGIQNLAVEVGQSQKVDMNGDGIFEFIFTISSASPQVSQKLLLSSNNSSPTVIKRSEDRPARLSSNYQISNQKVFESIVNPNDILALYSGSYGSGGDFANQPAGYLGVKFEVDGKILYGWIQYKAENNGTEGTIVDWAYESDPGKAIAAGKKKSFNWNLFLPAIIAGGGSE